MLSWKECREGTPEVKKDMVVSWINHKKMQGLNFKMHYMIKSMWTPILDIHIFEGLIRFFWDDFPQEFGTWMRGFVAIQPQWPLMQLLFQFCCSIKISLKNLIDKNIKTGDKEVAFSGSFL